MNTSGGIEQQFVICIQNGDYSASLEVRKVYLVIPDPSAAAHRFVRIIDESGEDYLYPEQYFLPIDLPSAVREALAVA